MKIYTHAFIVEIGFEQIPCLVLKQTFEQEEGFDELLSAAWEHTANNLMYDKKGNVIEIYKKINNNVTVLCQFSVEDYYSLLVDKRNEIAVDIRCSVVGFDNKVVENIYIHGIIKKNEIPENITVANKPLFNEKELKNDSIRTTPRK
jgi:hypothetical protein